MLDAECWEKGREVITLNKMIYVESQSKLELNMHQKKMLELAKRSHGMVEEKQQKDQEQRLKGRSIVEVSACGSTSSEVKN